MLVAGTVLVHLYAAAVALKSASTSPSPPPPSRIPSSSSSSSTSSDSIPSTSRPPVVPNPSAYAVFDRTAKLKQKNRAVRKDTEHSRLTDYVKDEVGAQLVDRLLVGLLTRCHVQSGLPS